jgi:hypothetical protein
MVGVEKLGWKIRVSCVRFFPRILSVSDDHWFPQPKYPACEHRADRGSLSRGGVNKKGLASRAHKIIENLFSVNTPQRLNG